jgi:DnaJ-class molecular chaperone
MKKMTCYGCKGKGHVSGEVCHICGGLGNIPAPPEPTPLEAEEKPEKE